jgi:hypothetical protein
MEDPIALFMALQENEVSVAVRGKAAEALLTLPSSFVTVRKLAEEPQFTAILRGIDGLRGSEHEAFFRKGDRCKAVFKNPETAELADAYYRLLYLRDSVVPRVLDDPMLGFFAEVMGDLWRDLISREVGESTEEEGEKSIKKRRKKDEHIEALFNQLLLAKTIDESFRNPAIARKVVYELIHDGEVKRKGVEVLLTMSSLDLDVWLDLFASVVAKEKRNTDEAYIMGIFGVLKNTLNGEQMLQGFYRNEYLIQLFKDVKESSDIFVLEAIELLAWFATSHGYHVRNWLTDNWELVTILMSWTIDEGSAVVKAAGLRLLRAIVRINHPTISKKVVLPIIRKVLLCRDEKNSLIFSSLQGVLYEAASTKQSALIKEVLAGICPSCDWPVVEVLKTQRDAIRSGVFVLKVRDSAFLERQDSISIIEDLPQYAGDLISDF